ncbi:hypothetical protein [Pontibaca salina]|uniref:Uncharacterized protein n=1 Tax=Pontibaca salina TaxID=2795731 RepID=A0A934HQR7_9RHOB|nr:hypothetical protein [Pontibaca salina]MBI6629737.1 hypothetical protein [Pontibaca salina]
MARDTKSAIGTIPVATPATPATPATLAANEWGLPNWKDAADYGNVENWTFMRWRWEFYRRRDELRAAFTRAEADDKNFFGEDDFRYNDRPAKGKPGYFVYVSRSRAAHEYLGFYWKLPDPSVSDHPEELIDARLPTGFAEDYWEKNSFSLSTADIVRLYAKNLSEQDENDLEKHYGRTVPMPSGPERAIISFDLAMPLGGQIERAKHFLKKVQYMHMGRSIPSKRRHPVKWLGYLRTLDAREAGATWAEISVLHPNTAQTEQTARDIWEAANALRFNF